MFFLWKKTYDASIIDQKLKYNILLNFIGSMIWKDSEDLHINSSWVNFINKYKITSQKET